MFVKKIPKKLLNHIFTYFDSHLLLTTYLKSNILKGFKIQSNYNFKENLESL